MHSIRRAQWPVLVFASAVALHVFMLSSLFTGWLDPLFHDSDHFGRGVDFYSVYQAGEAALHGRSLYDWPPAVTDVPYSFPFRYLPIMAYALAAPATVVSPSAAYWAEVCFIEAMVVTCAFITYRLAAEPEWGWIGAALWFAATPLYVEIYMGQWSLLMATLMLASVALYLSGSVRGGGAAWVVSLVVKSNSAVLAPVFLRLGWWRVLLAGAIVVVIAAGPYFAFRPDDARAFWDENFSSFWRDPPNRVAAFYTGDLGFMGFLTTVWLQADVSAKDAPIWLTGGVAFAIVGLSLAATFVPRAPRLTLLAALWMAVYFLVYSDVWEHHFVMLLPAIAIVVVREPSLRWYALAAFVFVAVPTPYVLFERWFDEHPQPFVPPELAWPAWAGITYHASKAVPTLLFWLATCLALLRGWDSEGSRAAEIARR